ncbi:hypothetical protein EC991_009685 [Linnemannia zychae]|nr:hypothetical protein EC991_009685 [Linnemannia zychae]
MRFTSLSVGAFIVASILVLSPVAVDAFRCKCTSNGFNSDSTSGIACCNELNGTVLKNAFGNFLGCDSDSLGGNSGVNYGKFDTCCKGKNSNYYRGCSVL